MKSLFCDDKDYTFLLSTTLLSICIYENEDFKGKVRCSCTIKDFSVIKDNKNCWILYCITADGKLYRVIQEDFIITRPGNFSEDDDIFQDLIPSEDLDLSLATEHVYQLLTDNSIYDFHDNINSLSLYENNLLAVNSLREYYQIQLYTGEFRSTQIPSLTLSKTFILDYPINSKGFNIKSQLYYVVPNQSPPENLLSSDSISISYDLFSSIFGDEISQLNTPVLLFCPTFGSVFYAPLKSVPSDDLTYATESHGMFKLFCQTSQQVVGIRYFYFPTKWEKRQEGSEESNQEIKAGLLIVTKDGKTLLVSTWLKHGVQFVPITIPGPVLCFDVYQDTLYHSNGRDISQSHIGTVIDGNTSEVTVYTENQSSLGLCNVCDLIKVKDQSLVQGCPCKLLCQSLDNKHRIINPGNNKDQSIEKPGQQIKDILVCLEKCHINREHLTNAKTLQSAFIGQLSIANFLMCSKDREKIFGHQFFVKYVPHSFEFEIHYELTNQSKVSISYDWKVYLTLKHTQSHLTKSVIFNLIHGLKCNETVAMETILPDQNVCLPFEIEIFLQLELPSELDMKKDSPNIFPVFLTHRILDIIYFVADERHHKKYVNIPPKDVKGVVHDLALARPISNCILNPDEAKNSMGEAVNLQINKPVEIMCCKEIRRKGKDELGLLRYLLQDAKQITDISTKSIQLSVCGGPKALVSVSVQEQVCISIQSTDLAMASALRLAFIRRLQVIDKTANQTGQSNAPSHKLSIQQDLLRELHEIEERVNTKPSEETRDYLQKIYCRLRQLDLM